MTLYLEDGDAFREWDGTEKIGGITYQPNIGDLWLADELAAIGLYSPIEPEVPPGKIIAGKTVQRVAGVVTYVYSLDSVPMKDLTRIQFRFMVKKLGVVSAIEAAIAAMPTDTEEEQNAQIMAETLWEDGQLFERSHPLFTQLAPSVGLTSAQIDEAWALALAI